MGRSIYRRRRDSKRNPLHWSTMVAGVGFLSLVAAACGSGDDDASGGDGLEIPVIVAASQGPIGRGFDVPAANGTHMAIEEINDAGGIKIGDKSYKLKPIDVDLTDNTSQGVSALQGAIAEEKPIAVFGPVTSGSLSAGHVVSQRAKVLHFSPASVAETLIGKPETPYLFKTLPNDPIYIGLAQYVKENLPDVQDVIVVEPDDATGQAATATITKWMEEEGFDVSGVTYPPDLTDFSSIVSNVLDEDPDFVIAGLSTQQATAIMRGITAAGDIKVLSALSQAVDFATQYDIGESNWLSTWYPVDLGNPSTLELEEFAEAYKDFTGESELDPALAQWSLTTYPYVYALADAMEAAGTVSDVAAITEHLKGAEGQKILNYRIEDNGQIVSDIQISHVIKDGETVEIFTVGP